jgi:hypothetical protein
MKTRNTRRGGEPRSDRPARPALPIDAAWVEGAAAEHLARYSSTRAHLKQLLLGRIRRAALKGHRRAAEGDLVEPVERRGRGQAARRASAHGRHDGRGAVGTAMRTTTTTTTASRRTTTTKQT